VRGGSLTSTVWPWLMCCSLCIVSSTSVSVSTVFGKSYSLYELRREGLNDSSVFSLCTLLILSSFSFSFGLILCDFSLGYESTRFGYDSLKGWWLSRAMPSKSGWLFLVANRATRGLWGSLCFLISGFSDLCCFSWLSLCSVFCRLAYWTTGLSAFKVTVTCLAIGLTDASSGLLIRCVANVCIDGGRSVCRSFSGHLSLVSKSTSIKPWKLSSISNLLASPINRLGVWQVSGKSSGSLGLSPFT